MSSTRPEQAPGTGAGATRENAERDRRDREWVRRVVKGDVAAFKALFENYYAPLCDLASRYVSSADAAEDLVQDLLARIWEQRARWTVRGSLRGYLHAAVRNRALNQLKHEKIVQRHRGLSHVAQAGIPVGAFGGRTDDVVRLKELSTLVRQAIETLPPRCRTTFILRRHHQMSYAEIAQNMNVSEKTVEAQMGIALKSLRENLAAWFDDEC